MQIWKSPNMFVFIWKQYTENLSFLILREFSRYLPVKFV